MLIVAATAKELGSALPGPLPELLHGIPAPWACNGRQHRLLVTGVGLLNAALFLGRVLSDEPEPVLNLGIAGSFSLEVLPLGATCVAQRETWPEYGLGTESGVDVRALKFPLAILGGEAVWDSLHLNPDDTAADMGLRLPDEWPRITAASVSTVSASPDRAADVGSRTGAQIENMEGFGLAFCCAHACVPFLEVRTVSNLVGSRDPAHWDLKGALKALGRAGEALL